MNCCKNCGKTTGLEYVVCLGDIVVLKQAIDELLQELR